MMRSYPCNCEVRSILLVLHVAIRPIVPLHAALLLARGRGWQPDIVTDQCCLASIV